MRLQKKQLKSGKCYAVLILRAFQCIYLLFLSVLLFIMGPNFMHFIAADFTLYLYVTSVSPIISSYLKYHLRGTTKSARLCMAHASKNS